MRARLQTLDDPQHPRPPPADGGRPGPGRPRLDICHVPLGSSSEDDLEGHGLLSGFEGEVVPHSDLAEYLAGGPDPSRPRILDRLAEDRQFPLAVVRLRRWAEVIDIGQLD